MKRLTVLATLLVSTGCASHPNAWRQVLAGAVTISPRTQGIAPVLLANSPCGPKPDRPASSCRKLAARCVGNPDGSSGWQWECRD